MLRSLTVVVALGVLLIALGAGCPKQTPKASPPPPETAPPTVQEPTPPEPPAAVPAKVEGAIEGEDLKVIEKTAGEAQSQDMTAWVGSWSGGTALWWHDGELGARLLVGFDAPQDGRYRVVLVPTLSYDYATVRFTLDDQPAGEELDLYAAEVQVGDEVDLGEFDLTKGEHRLGVEAVGINEKADPKTYGFGLDYLKLEPVPAAAP